jgi:GNAT superfamily N-acetyltransferase
VLALREAMPQDLDMIRAVVAVAYAPYVERMGRQPAPMSADYATAVARGEVWVAADDDAIAGLIVLVPAPDHLLLENVAVVPSAQGTGLGTRLLALAEAQARLRGLTEIRLYTNLAMTENLAYYPRRGYAETHRAQEDGYSRVYFTKRLPPLDDAENNQDGAG